MYPWAQATQTTNGGPQQSSLLVEHPGILSTRPRVLPGAYLHSGAPFRRLWGRPNGRFPPKNQWERAGGRSPPPFPVELWEGNGNLAPNKSTKSGPGAQISSGMTPWAGAPETHVHPGPGNIRDPRVPGTRMHPGPENARKPRNPNITYSVESDCGNAN